MDNKRILNIIAISGILLPFIVFIFDVKCIFKSISHIPCISCGLTRAFISIIHFDLISAIKYNVLSIPIIISIITFYILYFLYILFKINLIFNYYKIIYNNYKIIIIILLLGYIINLFIYYM